MQLLLASTLLLLTPFTTALSLPSDTLSARDEVSLSTLSTAMAEVIARDTPWQQASDDDDDDDDDDGAWDLAARDTPWQQASDEDDDDDELWALLERSFSPSDIELAKRTPGLWDDIKKKAKEVGGKVVDKAKDIVDDTKDLVVDATDGKIGECTWVKCAVDLGPTALSCAKTVLTKGKSKRDALKCIKGALKHAKNPPQSCKGCPQAIAKHYA